MARVESFCWAYDEKRQSYVFQMNRLILALTLVLTLAIVFWLVRARRKPAARPGGTHGPA